MILGNTFFADADGEGIWQLILLLVLIGISALANLIGKIKQKQEEEQRQHPPPRTSKPPTPIARSAPPARRSQRVASPKKSGFGEAVRQMTDILAGKPRFGSKSVVKQPRRSKAKTPDRVKGEKIVSPDLGKTVLTEEQQLRKKLLQEEIERRKRLKGVKPSFIPRIVADLGPMETHVRRIHVDLTSPKAAKAAIIYSEIIGPPKALRTTPEPWEWI